MSLVVFLICDGPGPHSEESYGVDTRGRTTKEQRLAANLWGWTHRGGKDYCTACSELRASGKEESREHGA